MLEDSETEKWGAEIRMINALFEKLETKALTLEEIKKITHDLRVAFHIALGKKYLEERGA
jgi:hypothetical protein